MVQLKNKRTMTFFRTLNRNSRTITKMVLLVLNFWHNNLQWDCSLWCFNVEYVFNWNLTILHNHFGSMIMVQ